MENYIRDLQCRQNRSITEAELHLYLSAKRYFNKDLEEFIRMPKDVKQIDLDGKITSKERNKERTDVELLDYLQSELEDRDSEIKELKQNIEKSKPENFFVYNNRLILLDDKGHNLVLKYKEDLLIEFIEEFTKLWDWMDRRTSYFKFNDDDNNEHIINKEEVRITIELFNKLNKMK